MPLYTKSDTLSTSQKLILEGNPYRTGISIINLDSSISIDVANSQEELRNSAGVRLFAQQTMTFKKSDLDDPTTPLHAISASGTPSIRIIEVFPIGFRKELGRVM